MITACAEQAQDIYNKQIKQTWEEDKKWLETDGGVTFVDFDKDAFMAAASNLGAELQSEDFFATKDLYDQVVKLNEAFEASH